MSTTCHISVGAQHGLSKHKYTSLLRLGVSGYSRPLSCVEPRFCPVSNSSLLTCPAGADALEYEKRKGSQVARHHIKDHRAKQLLVVPNDDKFVAVAAPEAFSRHSGTCMILGGQVTHLFTIFFCVVYVCLPYLPKRLATVVILTLS